MIRKYEGKRGVRWHVVVYDHGRRIFGGAFSTQREAKKAHAALLLLRSPENALDPLDMRLNVHLEGLKRVVGRRTYAGYRSIADNYHSILSSTASRGTG